MWRRIPAGVARRSTGARRGTPVTPKSAPAQPHGGGVRLEQDGRRFAPDQIKWSGQGRLGVRFGGRRLLSGAGGKADRRGGMSQTRLGSAARGPQASSDQPPQPTPII